MVALRGASRRAFTLRGASRRAFALRVVPRWAPGEAPGVRWASAELGRKAIVDSRVHGRGVTTCAASGRWPGHPRALNDHWSARDRLPNGRYAVLDLQGELMARYAWPSLVGPLEPIVGASLRSHMAFTSYEHPSTSTTEDAESSASATHFGVGLAPIVGLQWPFDVEPAGRRFVLFAELAPEFVYWLSHSARENHDHPADTGPAVVEALGAMGRTTFQVGTSFGFRLEFE